MDDNLAEQLDKLAQAVGNDQKNVNLALAEIQPKLDFIYNKGRNWLANSAALSTYWSKPSGSLSNGEVTMIGKGALLGVTQTSNQISRLNNLPTGKVALSFSAQSNQNGSLNVRLRRYFIKGLS